jgi:hypothetical protein
VEGDLKLDRLGLRVGGDGQVVDSQGRDRLEPDRLPDAGAAVVVDPLRATADGLLPPGLMGILAVLHPHHQAIALTGGADRVVVRFACGAQVGGDVQGEGDVAPAVVADLLAVDPHRRPEIDGAEVEQDVVRVPGGGDGEVPGVPDHLVDGGVADSGAGALVGEGDGDAARARGKGASVPPPLPEARVRVVESELPVPVEAGPPGADELGAGVLGPRRSGGHRSQVSPPSHSLAVGRGARAPKQGTLDALSA